MERAETCIYKVLISYTPAATKDLTLGFQRVHITCLSRIHDSNTAKGLVVFPTILIQLNKRKSTKSDPYFPLQFGSLQASERGKINVVYVQDVSTATCFPKPYIYHFKPIGLPQGQQRYVPCRDINMRSRFAVLISYRFLLIMYDLHTGWS